ncbi:YdcF family protein [Levilactobacillus lindianensis]|uniref:YdcF family protein n=1 Tax=Levilactobacillus lindianensis TaxID=2486018 RepID=UPI000F747954|nr:YdcF family protein [Levilactobacillus lindianensis]
MLGDLIIFILVVVGLTTWWQPQGLFSAAITVIGGGLITGLAYRSYGWGAQLLAGIGTICIGFIGLWGLLTLLLIAIRPQLIVRKRERLSLGMSLGIWGWLLLSIGWIWALGTGHFTGTLWPWLTFIPALSAYLGLLFAASVVGYLRVVIWHARRADTLVVLGAGLINGHHIGRVLAARLDTALHFARQQAHPVTIIVSGGQGPDEDLTEAAAMAAYLRNHHFPAAAIHLESAASNTQANLANSLAIWQRLPHHGGRVVVITNGYHLFRTRRLARHMGLNVGSIPAPTPLDYVPIGFAREFMAILVSNWHFHWLIALGLLVANLIWLLI